MEPPRVALRKLDAELAFFPGMKAPLKRKLKLAVFVPGRLADGCRIIPMEEHALAR